LRLRGPLTVKMNSDALLKAEHRKVI